LGENAGKAVQGVMDGAGNLALKIREAITGKTITDANKQMEILAAAQELETRIAAQADQNQADITKIEASSSSLLKSGWRPFIGWVCGVSIGCYYVPISVVYTICWTMGVVQAGWQMQPYHPPFGISELIGLVMSLLGLGGMRMWEKIKGVDGSSFPVDISGILKSNAKK
jgi:hypothetical protein